MNVLVDTSVWSLSLRRAKRVDDTASKELAELIREGRVVMIGPIRQELLSSTDFLICSAALRRELAVYTTDNDFIQYGKVLELNLHEPRG